MHRKTSAFSFAFATAFLAAIAVFSGCTSLLGDYDVASGVTEGGSGKSNGEACQTAGECGSTFCADGVCCESACSGTCETCNGAVKGKCDPVPDGQNPDQECPAEPRPDASAPPPVFDAAVEGGEDASVPDATAAETQDGGQVNLPEAGVTSNDVTCAGACNGNRACKYPDKAVTCGTKFCNSRSESGRFACDGKGRCELELAACNSFSCEGDECRTACAEQNDCQKTHFCKQGACAEKLARGLGCGTPDECKSGFCVVENGTGVCCNSGCSIGEFGVGASCKTAGAVGQCKCQVNCGTGSCRLFYLDSDGDGFGDKTGTPVNGSAIVGCDNASAPKGYSTTNDDCDDSDARAHPGQTAWFADVTLGKGLNDFNCDGTVSKETREYPGATCMVCGAPTACKESTTCPATKETTQSRLTCELYKNNTICLPGVTCDPYSCGYSRFVSNTAGFTTTVPCGTTASTFRTCGECSVIGSSPPSVVSSKQQRCH